jgi:membrane protease YdiL (CAAX protease family)
VYRVFSDCAAGFHPTSEFRFHHVHAGLAANSMRDPHLDVNSGSQESSIPGEVLPPQDVFLEDCVGGQANGAPSGGRNARPPGPGIWESIAWMIGVHLVQALAFAAAAVILAAVYLTTTGVNHLENDLASPLGLNALTKAVAVFLADNLFYLLAAAQLGTVIFGLGAVRLRLGRQGWSRLGWQMPAAGHWLLALLLVLPLWLLCSKLQQEMFYLFPTAHDEMAQLMQAMAQVSLPALILVIGAGPALGEELVFRGLIGRGLVARWGIVRGIALTSFLFGVMHVNPAQAIGVIPLGVAMHFLYLTTRSFWAPITLHLANNSLSVILLKLESNVPATMLLDDQTSPPIYAFIIAAAMITAIGLLLWETRVQYRLADGSVWNPGYASLEVPPPESEAFPVREEPRLLLIAGSTINSLGFLAVLWRLAAAS